MKKRVLALLLAVVMLVGVFAACGGDGTTSTTTTSGTTSTATGGETSTTGGEKEPAETNTSAGPADTTEPVTFTRYHQFDYDQLKEWGADMCSRALAKKFNITMLETKPDADSDSRFALMLTDKSWPESVLVQRTNYLPRLVERGGAVDLSQFFYDGSDYTESIGELTREVEAVNGVTYGFGTWSRSGLQGKGCTGGNYYWQINPEYYEQLGSPELNTLEDYHQFALKAKEANLTNYAGLSVYPIFFFHSGNGYNAYWPIARSLGVEQFVANQWVGTWEDGKSVVKWATKDDRVVEALKIANQWFNEGLFSADMFSNDDNLDYGLLSEGRAALAWADFSQDNSWNYRRNLTEHAGGKNTYEVIGAEGPSGYDLTMYPFYPHEDGVTVYGDINGISGWTQTVITPKAVDEGIGQRLYDLFGFMLSNEYSAWAQWGPPSKDADEQDVANAIYDDFDADGVPQIKINLDEMTAEQSDALGAWLWTGGPINADFVDAQKFAVDAQQPEGHHDFTAYIQTQVSSTKDHAVEGQKLVSIEWEGVTNAVATESDLGAARQALQDKFDQTIPLIIQAKSEDEFNSLLQEVNDYYDQNSGEEIREAYQGVIDQNVEMQGFSILDPAQKAYDEEK